MAFVLLAVLLEAVTAQFAVVPPDTVLAEVVPLAWPSWARGIWWALVAGAAGAYGALTATGRGPRRLGRVALFATPFALFAVGAALQAPWAAWH